MEYTVEKQISGDWIDLREASKDLYTLLDYLKIPGDEISVQIEMIKSSVEGDLVEYKRASLMPVFLTLENMKYQSINIEEMFRQEKNSKSLLLVIMLQKLLCTGNIIPSALRKKRNHQLVDIDVNTIIGDIRKRLKDDPSQRNNPAIKKILVQVSRYQKEYEKMKELYPKIKLDKMASYLSNFIQSFDSIFESVRKNYSELLAEETREKAAKTDIHLLASLPLKKMAAFYESQARIISEIRSTLAFARAEKYKTREPLVKLYNAKGKILENIESEYKHYEELCTKNPFLGNKNCSKRLSKEFKDEIITILNRILKSQ